MLSMHIKFAHACGACTTDLSAHAEHPLTVTQAAAVTPATSNSKDDSNNKTAHISRNASNSRMKATAGPPTQ